MEELAQNNNLSPEQQKELYLATLIHDLKNPIKAQIIILEQFYHEKFGKITQLQKEILKDLLSSSKFMDEMISSLLSVYKFDNGVVNLNKTQINLSNIIEICLKDVSPIAEEHCIFIKYINKTHSGMLYCDKNYIRRVISNMLNNIVFYSYKNTNPVVILDEDKLCVNIQFKSNGTPISEDLKLHIFDKYISGKNNKSGTGLGLYFCKKVVEAHGGIITLDSKNSDIEFNIKIPKLQSGESIVKFI